VSYASIGRGEDLISTVLESAAYLQVQTDIHDTRSDTIADHSLGIEGPNHGKSRYKTKKNKQL
jgi:hypothetical protein